MRILLASDLHYELRQYDWLISATPRFDAVVVAGDHIDASGRVPGSVQIAALSASFEAMASKGHLLVCSGNHDLNTRSAAGEKTAGWLSKLRGDTLAVDGDSPRIGDTLFTVCPWWDGPDARAGVERLLDATAARRGDSRWVWVYHAPPVGALSWTGKRHYGDTLLTELVQRHAPTAVLCGHVHEAPFKRGGGWMERVGCTTLFNPGRQIGTVPARIELDFAQNTARWISFEGIEENKIQ